MPPNFKVLKDDYQDMGQNYAIYYNIRFNENAIRELIKNIQSSKFYNKLAFHKGAWTTDIVYPIDSIKAIWVKSPAGYDFYRKKGLTDYFISLDTLTNILKYSEFAN